MINVEIMYKVGWIFSAIVSLLLIYYMWAKNKSDRIMKKAFWTVILCLPAIGWLFYLGFYNIPKKNIIKAEQSNVDYPPMNNFLP